MFVLCAACTYMYMYCTPQASLAEVHRELYSLMNDVCDILSDVPPATVSTLLGTTAAHIQRKLAKR